MTTPTTAIKLRYEKVAEIAHALDEDFNCDPVFDPEFVRHLCEQMADASERLLAAIDEWLNAPD